MRILVVSDLHGDLGAAERARARFEPQLMLCCGDWGDRAEVDEAAMRALVGVLPVYTTFGNHDPLELLGRITNRDGSPILIASGSVAAIGGLRVAAIGGIWARSHAQPFYVTDDDVGECAARIAQSGSVDILITHGCPIGLADLTPGGRHGGQRCFLDANRTIGPRLHLCGHLHRAQERTLADGRRVMNVGATPAGSVVVVETDGLGRLLEARLECAPAE